MINLNKENYFDFMLGLKIIAIFNEVKFEWNLTSDCRHFLPQVNKSYIITKKRLRKVLAFYHPFC